MIDLVKLFNKAVETPDFEVKPKDPNKPVTPSIKPSMLGTACYRKLYYSYNKVEEDSKFPIKNTRIMKLGTAVGEMLVAEYRKLGIVIDYIDKDGKTPIYHGKPNNEFPLKSDVLQVKLAFIDMVFIEDGKLWLAEFKSSNTDKFDMLKRTNSCDFQHKHQSLIYLYIFNKMLADGEFSHIPQLNGFTQAEGIAVVYLNKNTSYMHQVILLRDDEFFMYMAKKIQAIQAFTQAKELPPKTPEYCGTCPWAKKCQKNALQ